MSWRVRHGPTSESNTPIESTVAHPDDPQAPTDPDCGFALDSFACRKYHLDHPIDEG